MFGKSDTTAIVLSTLSQEVMYIHLLASLAVEQLKKEGSKTPLTLPNWEVGVGADLYPCGSMAWYYKRVKCSPI